MLIILFFQTQSWVCILFFFVLVSFLLKNLHFRCISDVSACLGVFLNRKKHPFTLFWCASFVFNLHLPQHKTPRPPRQTLPTPQLQRRSLAIGLFRLMSEWPWASLQSSGVECLKPPKASHSPFTAAMETTPSPAPTARWRTFPRWDGHDVEAFSLPRTVKVISSTASFFFCLCHLRLRMGVVKWRVVNCWRFGPSKEPPTLTTTRWSFVISQMIQKTALLSCMSMVKSGNIV